MDSGKTVTLLLKEWAEGDQEALQQLAPLVYRELRRLARRALRRETPGEALQATALVNEAFLRLMEAKVGWRDRAHFFALAARLMRRILIDQARARGRLKRGKNCGQISLGGANVGVEPPSADLLALDEAMRRLSESDPLQSQAIELKYFAGLNAREIGAVLKLPERRVYRELEFAKAWLARELAR